MSEPKHLKRYKGIGMDSDWEIDFAKRCDKLEILWEKGNHGLTYFTHNNIERTYYPDFYLPDRNMYVEINVHPLEELELILKLNPSISLYIIDKLEDIKKFK